MMCAAVSILMSHMNGEKEFADLSSKELGLIPLEYLIKYSTAFELLLIFGKLPLSYQNNLQLRQSLPCFGHFPDSRTQFDGPPPAQKNCPICIGNTNNFEFV